MGMQRLLLGLVLFGCAGAWAAEEAIASVVGSTRKAASKRRDYKEFLREIKGHRLPAELLHEVAGLSEGNHLVEFPYVLKRASIEVPWPDSAYVFWSPDDQCVACFERTTRKGVFIIEPFSGAIKQNLPCGDLDSPMFASWGPNNHLAVGYGDGNIVIWDALGGARLSTLSYPLEQAGISAEIHSLVWGQGDIVSSYYGSGSAVRWEALRASITPAPITGAVRPCWSNDKKYVVYSTGALCAVVDDNLQPLFSDPVFPVLERLFFPTCWSIDSRFITSGVSVYDMHQKRSYGLQFPVDRKSVRIAYRHMMDKATFEELIEDVNWGPDGLLGVCFRYNDDLSQKCFFITDLYKNEIVYKEIINNLTAFAWSTSGDYILMCYGQSARIMPTTLGDLFIRERMVLKNINEALTDPKQKFVLLAGSELNPELLKKLHSVVITVTEICDIAIKQMKKDELSDRDLDVLVRIARFALPGLPDGVAELEHVLDSIKVQCGQDSWSPGSDGKGVAELTDAQLAVLQRYPALYAIIKPYVVSAGERRVTKDRADQISAAREAREREEAQAVLDDFAMAIVP